MAIASLILTISKPLAAAVDDALAARTDIVDSKRIPDEDEHTRRLALVLDCPSDVLSQAMRELNDLPGVVDLNFVFANYEDDLDTACEPQTKL